MIMIVYNYSMVLPCHLLSCCCLVLVEWLGDGQADELYSRGGKVRGMGRRRTASRGGPPPLINPVESPESPVNAA